MLAYVFWHWKRDATSAAEYESRLARFHAALRTSPPEGLQSSGSYALRGAPWANDGDDAYEDWYVVRSSADLDVLNAAAVSASRVAPHDAAAAVAGGGTAGLYRLRSGTPLQAPALASWFAKPDGWSYADLLSRLEPVVSGAGAALWGRQMTLGPAREFCLHSLTMPTLPDPIDTLSLPLRTVFPGDR